MHRVTLERERQKVGRQRVEVESHTGLSRY